MIAGILDSEPQLRSKKELIERFVSENLPDLQGDQNLREAFAAFWSNQKIEALKKLSTDENLNKKGLEEIIGQYLFTEMPPMRDEVISIMETRPKLKERKTVAERIISKIRLFVQTYIDGID